ncbi:hypothetical protein I7I50_09702 [Histoplasma capsulatum G186AR]|uniref:Uncharacterized protein n=1 Tax=Ajellomyces capsulatus TaxID=5037 RepID=A0A8H8D0G2_AJECA|nr:hypothetical protein I7I52_07232 [Histoplasma capsulatum]QSS74492.1 hypothetical protein I7I50_09702 [Histoplasma capsulatum G186AR]
MACWVCFDSAFSGSLLFPSPTSSPWSFSVLNLDLPHPSLVWLSRCFCGMLFRHEAHSPFPLQRLFHPTTHYALRTTHHLTNPTLLPIPVPVPRSWQMLFYFFVSLHSSVLLSFNLP